VNVTPEPPGPNCANGGERIDIGIDTNGDGILEPNEIQKTAYVCNGAGLPQGGACTLGALQCSGLQQQLCSAAGQWQDIGTPCAQYCLAGACTPCAPGATQCADNSSLQTCGADGQWQPGVACSGAGLGGACSNGACDPLVPTSIAFLSPTSGEVMTPCFPVTYEVLDQNGNVYTGPDAPVMGMQASCAGAFYLDPACTQAADYFEGLPFQSLPVAGAYVGAMYFSPVLECPTTTFGVFTWAGPILEGQSPAVALF
jgi:hypothetical protein